MFVFALEHGYYSEECEAQILFSSWEKAIIWADDFMKKESSDKWTQCSLPSDRESVFWKQDGARRYLSIDKVEVL